MRTMPNRPEDYGNIERSGKLKVVEQVLRMWKAQGHRVLLFTQVCYLAIEFLLGYAVHVTFGEFASVLCSVDVSL